MNVLDLLKEKNIAPKKMSGTKGGEYHSPCPGCGGNDRFHVWPEQNNGAGSFWCRGCEKGGDAIQFLIEFDGKTFQEACVALGRDLTEAPKRLTRPGKPEIPVWTPEPVQEPAGVDVALWREKAGKFIEWSHQHLMNSPATLNFLAARGIRPETIVRFKLGLNPGDKGKSAVFRPRSAWGLPVEMKDGKEKRLWLPRGLVVPYFVDETPVRIRIRRPDADLTEGFNQRYFVVPGSRMDRSLFGPDRKAFVVVETELDAMLLFQEAGVMVGAVAMGTSHAKPDPVCHAALQKAVCILVALDFDKAGAGGWRWWPGQYSQAERWPVPAGKDPGDAFKAGINLRDWVIAGLPPVLTMGADAVSPKNGQVPSEPEPGTDTDDAEKQEVAAPGSVATAPIPNSVLELRKLINRFPFKIEYSTTKMRLIENETWARNNWATSQRISRLIFFDPDVQAFLSAHPNGLITRENFDGGRSA